MRFGGNMFIFQVSSQRRFSPTGGEKKIGTDRARGVKRRFRDEIRKDWKYFLKKELTLSP